MTLIDFKCDYCNYEWENLFKTKKEIKNSITCSQCSRKADRVWNTMNFLNLTNGAMYGRYEPAFGEVVRDYGHKQQLLKKYGVIESSDRSGGSNCYKETETKQDKVRKELAKSSLIT